MPPDTVSVLQVRHGVPRRVVLGEINLLRALAPYIVG